LVFVGPKRCRLHYLLIPRYREFVEGTVIWGGYGPRLFSREGQNQVADIISLLLRKPNSRHAAIQIYEARDLAEKHEDVPCTCTLQFFCATAYSR
jgi:thymidylate synthase